MLKETRADKAERWIRRGLKWLGYGLLVVIGIYVVGTTSAMVRFYRHHHGEPYKFGVSFSTKYARELGLNWQETYMALINDAGARRFRLMSYWDLGEPAPGVYNFDELDFQMQEAEKAGAKVTLAVGMRQPRYPECHVPSWVKSVSIPDRNRALEKYMAATIERYKTSPALESYQLENEALNTAFGDCHDFNRSRLETEYRLMKALDPKHPTIVSVSNEFGLPVFGPQPDVVGFSIYHRVYESRVLHRYFDYPFPALWHGSRAAIIEQYEHHPVIIHELQTEPWGPRATVDMSLEEQNEAMDLEHMKANINYAKRTGIHEVYLWGGEWWYWRLTKFHDPSFLNYAKTVFASSR